MIRTYMQKYLYIRVGIGLLSTLLLLLGVSGCSSQPKTADSAGMLWGRANAKEIDINSKIGGRVIQLNVKEGDVVKKGQVIACIDQRDLVAQAEQAKASINALQAQRQQASAETAMQYGTAHSDTGIAMANLAAADSNLKLAKADYLRYQELIGEGAVSEQSFEAYRTKYKTAQAAYEQAEAAVHKANAGLLQTDVNLANQSVVEKKIEQAEAVLEQIHVSIDETIIRAPFDGIITEKYIEEGSMISQGTPLVALQDCKDNWVDFKVLETQLPDYELQQQVVLQARDGQTRVEGVIVDISKKAEFATRRATNERGNESDIISYNVKVQVNSEKLRPGMRFALVRKDAS
jgi:HlyD family secretion protein